MTNKEIFKQAAEAWEKLKLPNFKVDGWLDGKYKEFTVPEVLKIASERLRS